MFADRAEAGRKLADALDRWRGAADAVVVGLASGGVVVAHAVAEALGLPLDALAVRKVGHPRQPEYAIGAVTPWTRWEREARDVSPAERARRTDAATEAARALDARLHCGRPPLAVSGRAVLLVDDGLATGATMHAATAWARAQGASRTVVAVPVGAADTVAALTEEADEVVCLVRRHDLGAVGRWYRDFDQVAPETVERLLGGSSASGARPDQGP